MAIHTVPDRETAQPIPLVPGESPRDLQITASVLAGGSTAELAAGAIAIVLAVIGLAGGWPQLMAQLATLVAGAGLLAHGAAVAARWKRVMRSLDGDEQGLVGGGIGLEVVGGGSAIVLAVLAWAGVAPAGMLDAAAIVIGGSLVLASAVPPQLATAAADRDVTLQRRMRQSLVASAGMMLLVGIASAVLGILGIVGVSPALPIALVAMLCVGAALLLAGGAGAFKFARVLTLT